MTSPADDDADSGIRYSTDEAVMTGLFSPLGRDDPQAVLRRSTVPGCRHAVVAAVLRDPRFSAPVIAPSDDLMFQMLSRWMLRVDGDRHRRVRARFAGLFTPRRVERFRPLVQGQTEALLDALDAQTDVDLVRDFARPLPLAVICEVVGVPVERRPWLGRATTVLGQAFANQRERAYVQQGNAAAAELLDYFSSALGGRRTARGDDLMSVLAEDGFADEQDRADVVANCVFFVMAGHETTTTLIAGGVDLLCRNATQLAQLQQDSSRWPAAVEELLRATSPVTLTAALAREDVEIASEHFVAGSQRLLSYAAANHDPTVFAAPDVIDITRDPTEHLAFSVGAHYCLGAPLARMEAQVALQALFDRYPDLRVREPVWRGSAPLRQIESLPASVSR